VLTYRDDDGLPVEPEWYAPVLPMLLVNGARGIGTGYSTYVPPHNPRQLMRMLTSWLEGNRDALDEKMEPYFQGFKGEVSADGTVTGVYRKDKEDYVVTELPPGTWTADYREWLEKEMADGHIKDFVDVSTDTEVNIRIKGIEEALLKKSLTEKVKLTNMHAFNSRGVITKYETANEILKEFAHVRLDLYEKRRVQQIADLMSLLPYHLNVMRFIEDQILDKPKADLRRKTHDECDGILAGAGYNKIDDKFDYLMRLPVSTFTAESIRKNQQKLDELRTEIQRLERLSSAEMWLSELSGI
jgi:DNA topoisomerase-2